MAYNQLKRSEYLGLAEAVEEFRNQPEISQPTGSPSILHTNYTVINLAHDKTGLTEKPEVCRVMPNFSRYLSVGR